MSDIKKAQLDNTYQFLSTASHPQYRLGNFLSSYADKEHELWIDPLDPKLIKFMTLPRTIKYVHKGLSITTASYRTYGNTSLWFLFILCSDYAHPQQIPLGEVIYLPSSDAVAGVLKETTKKGDQGKIIVI